MKLRLRASYKSPHATAFIAAIIALGATILSWLLLEPLFNSTLKSYQWALFHGIGLITDLLLATLVYLIVDRSGRLKTAIRQHTEDLSRELEERKLVEAELRRTQDELEDRVTERTAAMQAALAELQIEEDALKDSEERYRTLFDNLTDTVIIHTDEGDVVEVNRAASYNLGYSRDELLQLNLKKIDIPEFGRMIPERVQEVLRNGHALFESVHVRRDGSQIPVEVNVRLIDYRGKLVLLSISRDISLRKQAQKAFEESERKLRNLIEKSGDGIVMIDERGSIIEWNEAEEGVTGITRENVLGRSLADVQFESAPPDKKTPILYDALKHDFDQILTTGQSPWMSHLQENDLVRSDGTHRYVQVQVFPIKTQNGFMLGAISRDVTEQKQRENELRNYRDQLEELVSARTKELDQTNEQVRKEMGEREQAEAIIRLQTSALEAAANGIVITDLTGKIIWVNTSFSTLTGYTSAEAIGKNPRLLKSGMHGPDFYCNLWQTISSGAVWKGELINRRKDGSFYIEEMTITPVYQAGMSITHFIAIKEDITHRKQAQQDLKENEAKLRAIFEQSPDAFFINNENDEIIDVNPAACQLMGYSRDELVRMRVPDCVAPELRVKTGTQIKTELAKNVVFEGMNLHRDGRLIPVEVRTTHLTGTGGNLVLSIVRDISSRKKAEEEIQRQLQNLTALRAIDNAINASLDLRVTLNVLLEHLGAQLHVHAADILLVNPHTQMLEYAAARGFRTSALQYTRLYLGEGYAGRAALERATIHISDLTTYADKPVSEAAQIPEIAEQAVSALSFRRSTLSPLQRAIRDEGFITYFGVPLIAKGRVVGVLEIFHRTPLSPNQDWTDLLQTLATQAAIAIDNAQLLNDLQRSNTELALAYDATIEGWSRALDLRDNETEGHSRRVSELTLRLARSMGVKDNDLVHIRRGALLHDIGKMGIPDSILLKQGPLDADEMEQMRKHPAIAYELLFQIDFLRPAVDIPYCHHERWDGGGYPRGLRGNDIPLSARIFSVVDVWDALLSNRPYRPAWEYTAALDFIRENTGRHFDPRVVDEFLKIVEEE